MQSVAAIEYRPCVGAMIINKSGLVLVGQRFNATKEAWQMPQGGIDLGETAKQAVVREIGEELGIDDVESTLDFLYESHSWYSYDFPQDRIYAGNGREGQKYRGQKQKGFLFKFGEGEGGIGKIDLDKVKHKEFSMINWVEMKRLQDLVVYFKKEVYRKVVDEFGAFLLK